jgi:hypothetical protein
MRIIYQGILLWDLWAMQSTALPLCIITASFSTLTVRNSNKRNYILSYCICLHDCMKITEKFTLQYQVFSHKFYVKCNSTRNSHMKRSGSLQKHSSEPYIHSKNNCCVDSKQKHQCQELREEKWTKLELSLTSCLACIF